MTTHRARLVPVLLLLLCSSAVIASAKRVSLAEFAKRPNFNDPLGAVLTPNNNNKHNKHNIYNNDNNNGYSPYTRHLDGRELSLHPKHRSLLERTAANGEKVSDRFCAMDDKDNECNWKEYGLYLLGIFLLRLIFAVLILIIVPVFAVGRYCCGCFGGHEPTEGWVFPGEPLDGYTYYQILTVKVVVGAVAGGATICLIVGYVGNANVGGGLKTLATALSDAGEELVERLTTIKETLEDLEHTEDEAADLDVSSAEEIRDRLNEFEKQVRSYNGLRSAAINISFLVPTLCIIGGTVMAVMNVTAMSPVLATFMWGTTSVLWVSAGIHVAVGTVSRDVCAEFDTYTNTNSSNWDALNDTALASILECAKDGQSAFQEYVDAIDQGIQDANDDLCDQLYGTGGFCAFIWVNCPGSAETCQGYKDVDNITVNDLPNEYSVEECASQCTNPAIKLQANEIMDVYYEIEEYDRVLNEEVKPLLQCDYINKIIDTITEAFCEKMVGGVRDVRRASQATAVMIFAGGVGLIMGHKRFIPLSDALDADGKKGSRGGSVSGNSKQRSGNGTSDAGDAGDKDVEMESGSEGYVTYESYST